MNQAELCIFADRDHPKMCGPFSFGAFSYATNGHILLRVPRSEDVPEWEALNEQAEGLFDGLDFFTLAAALVKIPDFPQPEPEPCSTCNGTGKVGTCPECEGEGIVTFENDFNEYECDCETCGGAGTVKGYNRSCPLCDGDGKLTEAKRIPVGDCGCGFSSRYLNLMRKHLPGVKIAPTSPEGMNYFKWDSGDGLIMPLRCSCASLKAFSGRKARACNAESIIARHPGGRSSPSRGLPKEA